MKPRTTCKYKLTILFPLLALAGCQVLSNTSQLPSVPSHVGMNLVGKWDYWMRPEVPGTYVVRGTLVIKEESCTAYTETCGITGYLELGSSNNATTYAISGFSNSKEKLVRFSYKAMTLTGHDPLYEVVEFDSFPTSVQAGTMVGYVISFNQRLPGAQYTDSVALEAAGRGMTMMAGRVSAWPLPKD